MPDVVSGNLAQFTQDVKTNILGGESNNFLVFGQSAKSSISKANSNSEMHLSQTAVAHKSASALSCSSLLLFNQSASKEPHNLNPGNFFFVWNSCQRAIGLAASNKITFSQATDFIYSNTQISQLSLTQEVELTKIKVYPIVQSFTFVDLVSVYIPRKSFIAIPITIPTKPLVDRFKVTYGRTVKLRAPDFGNSIKLETNRISRYSRGGDIVIYKDDIWPETREFTWNFSYLTKEKVDDLKSLLKESLGLNVTINDHEGNNWYGVILSPGTQAAEVARNNFSLQLSFQGEAV